MKTRRHPVLSIALVSGIFLTACSSTGRNGADEDADLNLVMLPNITLEGTILSRELGDLPEYPDPTTGPADTASIRIDRIVSIENPDDQPVPEEIQEGAEVRLAFAYSLRPALERVLPGEVVEDGETVSCSMGGQRFFIEEDLLVYESGDCNIEEIEETELPGLVENDRFRAMVHPLAVDGGTGSIANLTLYEKLND